MTPDQVAALNAVALILQQIGTWKIGTLIAAVIMGPWIVTVVALYLGVKWFAGFKAMYNNNVILVKNYEALTKDHKEMIVYNTTIMTEVKETADNNLFCPINRDRIHQREVKEIRPNV
jgi:phage FluMu gp28-like protein